MNIYQLMTSTYSALEGIASFCSSVVTEVANSQTGRFARSISTGIPELHRIAGVVREIYRVVSVLLSELRTIIHRRNDDVPHSLTVQLGLENAPNLEAYYQILAQSGSYLRYADGEILPRSTQFACPAYRVKKTISFPEGLRGIVIEPVVKAPNQMPMIVFQGTDFRNLHNIADDTNINVAELNVTKYQRQLEKEIEALALEHDSRIHLLGHSYGGAVAQRLTALFPQLVGRCTYYNAPAVGEQAVRTYQRNLSQMEQHMPRPHVRSYRHKNDVASLLGGTPLPTDPGFNLSCGRSEDGISFIEAHSLNTLSTGAPCVDSVQVLRTVRLFSEFAERNRRHLSKVIPLYKHIRRVFA